MDWWSLNNREKHEVTDEEFEKYLKYECMIKGVPYVVEGAEGEEVSVPPPTFETTAQVVVNINGQYIAFDTAEKARDFIDLGPRVAEERWEARTNVSNYVVKEPYKLEIETLMVCNAGELEAKRLEIQKYRKAKEDLQKTLRLIREATTNTQGAISDMISDRDNIKMRVGLFDSIKETWESYLELTKGNEDMAYSFLTKIHAKTEVKEMFEWFNIPNPVVKGVNTNLAE